MLSNLFSEHQRYYFDNMQAILCFVRGWCYVQQKIFHSRLMKDPQNLIMYCCVIFSSFFGSCVAGNLVATQKNLITVDIHLSEPRLFCILILKNHDSTNDENHTSRIFLTNIRILSIINLSSSLRSSKSFRSNPPSFCASTCQSFSSTHAAL